MYGRGPGLRLETYAWSRQVKLGIVVNVMDSQSSGATTYRLAADAMNLGHEVWIMSTGGFAYNPNDTM